MDWTSALQDTALIAGVSTAIFVVLDLVKRTYYKLPWGWVKKTPGEVWFALSIAFGLLVAVVVLWPTITSGETGIVAKASAAIYGVVFGGGSKLINAVASSAGAKLKVYKESVSPSITAPIETPMAIPAPEFSEPSATETSPITEPKSIVSVKLVKRVAPDADYVIINDDVYEITKEEKNERN